MSIAAQLKPGSRISNSDNNWEKNCMGKTCMPFAILTLAFDVKNAVFDFCLEANLK